MKWRMAQGAILLSISMAAVGAVAATRQPAEADLIVVTELPSIGNDAISEAAQPEVPMRSGRIDDQIARTEANQPVSVRVAGIGLEASVISVGVDDNNQFAVPSASTVGWYEFSSEPGQPGASVLAAHVDYGGEPGAFFNLSEVLPGDTLEVELADGDVVTYRVIGNTEYDKAELPAGDLFRKDGESVLQLITCGGQFDPEERSYEANIVVSAVPIAA